MQSHHLPIDNVHRESGFVRTSLASEFPHEPRQPWENATKRLSPSEANVLGMVIG
jgi:hypothetical protein